MQSKLNMGGSLMTKLIRIPQAPVSWKLRNMLRWGYIEGFINNKIARLFSKITGIPTLVAELSAVVIRKDGTKINYGVLGFKVVTTAFVEDMVDELIAESSAWGDYKFHDSGVGTTGAVIGDTDIETTDGESRATGTQVENANNIYESVGTIAYSTGKAITEHGLFNIGAGGILMDRTVFGAINVVNGDSIQFTYDLTVAAGG